MFYIIESEEQLTHLSALGEEGGYVDLITSNSYYHPLLSTLVAVYVRPCSHHTGYIIPVNHTEGLSVPISSIERVLERYSTLYVFSKKNFLYYLKHGNIQDINLMYSMVEYESLQLPNPPQVLTWYYNQYREKKDLSTILPISKLYEMCERNYRSLEEIIQDYKYMTEDPSWKFYNNIATGVFYLAESAGVRVIYDKFIEKFTPACPKFSIEDNIVYTSYNLYNPTSRPTSAFNSVNFAAIPKKEEFRKCFIPKKGKFVEMDFDGYHIRLIGEVVGYSFTPESVHTQLGRHYFDKEELTQEEYQQSKQNTFQIMYGGVPDRWRHIEFFDKVAIYTQTLWKEFCEKGVVRAPISNKPFTSKLKEMNAQKLFNYVIQSLETSRNVLILREVLRYLQTKKTSIALYTYDAILFDFNYEDGRETLENIKAILEDKGRYPVKIKFGDNLILD
jgi:hypothetical protein